MPEEIIIFQRASRHIVSNADLEVDKVHVNLDITFFIYLFQNLSGYKDCVDSTSSGSESKLAFF